ncbi:MAG TPA: AI-2E family transporter [Actinomycetota bacterium]
MAVQPLTLGDRIRHSGIIAWSLIGIGLVLYGFFRFLLGPVAVVFAPLAIALVVTYLLNPIVGILVRRGMRRGWAVLLIYLVFLMVVGVILGLLIPVIAHQVSGFIDAVPGYVQDIVDAINRFAARRNLDFRLDISSEQISDVITDNRETIISFLGGVGSVAGQILHILISIVIGIILSVYLLLDLPKIQHSVMAVVPDERRAEVRDLAERVGSALGGFFRGQLFVALFVGVASAIGLTLIKLPFAVLIGLIAGIFNLVPLIGPFLAAVPAVLVALLSDHPSRAIWALVVLLVVQQIDNHIISPNVMGRTVRLHPVTVMLALLVGATIAGILGMLVVIPGVAAAKIVITFLWDRRHHFVAVEPAAEDETAPG